MSRAVGTIQAFGLGLMFAAAAIVAACGGGAGDVTDPPGGAEAVDSLVLNLDSADVIVGDTVRLTAEARDANGQVVPGVRLTYASSDPAVATVNDDGLVTAVDLGEAEIEVGIAGEASVSARSAALSYSAVMTSRRVVRVSILPIVTIVPGEQTLDPRATSQYLAVLTDIRGRQLPTRPATWSSSNPSVATIDNAGLATAALEGDTEITVSFQIPGRRGTFTEQVPLHVAVCGGVLGVRSWTVGADLVYKAGGHHAPTRSTYVVDQRSVAGASLVPIEGQTGADSMVWQGKTSGNFGVTEVRLNNSVRFPVPPPVNEGVTREAAAGAILDGPTAIARLTIKRPSGGSRTCTYNFQYGDFFSWDITNNQGAPPISKSGPTGVARVIGKEVGPRSRNGGWLLGSPESADAVRLPARAFMNLVPTSDYTVGSTIGVQTIIQLGGASATWGEATFSYVVTGVLP